MENNICSPNDIEEMLKFLYWCENNPHLVFGHESKYDSVQLFCEKVKNFKKYKSCEKKLKSILPVNSWVKLSVEGIEIGAIFLEKVVSKGIYFEDWNMTTPRLFKYSWKIDKTVYIARTIFFSVVATVIFIFFKIALFG